MADQNQNQNKNASNNTPNAGAPVAAQMPGADFLRKMVEEQTTRMTHLFDEAAKWQHQWSDYGATQIGELSGLMKAQFKYANDMASDWRKMSLDSAKKTMELFNR